MPSFSAKLRRRQLDELLAGKDLPSLKRGYIREIRDALEMSSYQLADRMGLSRSTVKQLETNERNGSITLRSLTRAAEAMGCRLIYGFVPVSSLEQIVDEQATRKAAEIASTVNRTMALEQQEPDAATTDSMIRDIAEELRRRGKRDLWS